VDQAATFFAGAKGTTYELRYLLLVGTGLRSGEALRLTWQDIDFKSGYLTVQHGKTSKARRAVLLPAALLVQLHAVRGAGLVFHRNGKPLDPRARTIRDPHFFPLVTRLDCRRCDCTICAISTAPISLRRASMWHPWLSGSGTPAKPSR
jgi:hypothetical protein